MHTYLYRPRDWLPTYLQGRFKLEELTLSCSGDYLPAEKAVMNPIDEAHPGCDECIEIMYVYVIENGNEVDITFDLTHEQLSEIEEEMLEKM